MTTKNIWKDHYSTLKPSCVSCLEKGTDQEEYAFCSTEKELVPIYEEIWSGRKYEKRLVHTFKNVYSCNVYHWIIYQGQGKITKNEF